jgi:hypothetical protein
LCILLVILPVRIARREAARSKQVLQQALQDLTAQAAADDVKATKEKDGSGSGAASTTAASTSLLPSSFGSSSYPFPSSTSSWSNSNNVPSQYSHLDSMECRRCKHQIQLQEQQKLHVQLQGVVVDRRFACDEDEEKSTNAFEEEAESHSLASCEQSSLSSLPPLSKPPPNFFQRAPVAAQQEHQQEQQPPRYFGFLPSFVGGGDQSKEEEEEAHRQARFQRSLFGFGKQLQQNQQHQQQQEKQLQQKQQDDELASQDSNPYSYLSMSSLTNTEAYQQGDMQEGLFAWSANSATAAGWIEETASYEDEYV